jgi:hypothetical protein
VAKLLVALRIKEELTMKNLMKLGLAFAMSLGLAFGAVACGDDDGGKTTVKDAAPKDAAKTPDSGGGGGDAGN